MTASVSGLVVVGAQSVASAVPTVFHAIPSTFAADLAQANTDNAGDTIYMAAGAYSGPVLIEGSLNLIGTSEGSTVISNGSVCESVLEVSEDITVNVSNLTVTGGNDVDCEFGAGGVFNEGHLTMSYVAVTGNTYQEGIDAAGGIINAFGGTLNLDYSAVTRNSATDVEFCAGGIANGYEGAALTMYQTIVSQNTCTDFEDGVGGILNGTHGGIGGPNAEQGSNENIPDGIGSAEIYQSTVTANATTAPTIVGGTENGGAGEVGAGGIMNFGSMYLSGASITGNSGNGPEAGCGGGICNDGTMTVAGGLVASNKVMDHGSFGPDAAGGGIYNGASLTMTGPGGVDSNLSGTGAGLLNDCLGVINLTGTSVLSNVAEDFGGGIYNGSDETPSLTMTGATVAHNSPDQVDTAFDECPNLFGKIVVP